MSAKAMTKGAFSVKAYPGDAKTLLPLRAITHAPPRGMSTVVHHHRGTAGSGWWEQQRRRQAQAIDPPRRRGIEDL